MFAEVAGDGLLRSGTASPRSLGWCGRARPARQDLALPGALSGCPRSAAVPSSLARAPMSRGWRPADSNTGAGGVQLHPGGVVVARAPGRRRRPGPGVRPASYGASTCCHKRPGPAESSGRRAALGSSSARATRPPACAANAVRYGVPIAAAAPAPEARPRAGRAAARSPVASARPRPRRPATAPVSGGSACSAGARSRPAMPGPRISLRGPQRPESWLHLLAASACRRVRPLGQVEAAHAAGAAPPAGSEPPRRSKPASTAGGSSLTCTA